MVLVIFLWLTVTLLPQAAPLNKFRWPLEFQGMTLKLLYVNLSFLWEALSRKMCILGDSCVTEYSFSTFQLDADAALQLFIETLLHNTNASQSQGDVSTGSTKQQRSKLLAKALEMVPLLTSTKDLVISLSGILHKVDEWWNECIGSFQTALLLLTNQIYMVTNWKSKSYIFL